FFQAEDGIRDYKVTGVQTCALPIFIFSVNGPRRLCQKRQIRIVSPRIMRFFDWGMKTMHAKFKIATAVAVAIAAMALSNPASARSEERRVGKEGSAGELVLQRRANL